jgi:hypothetical protein
MGKEKPRWPYRLRGNSVFGEPDTYWRGRYVVFPCESNFFTIFDNSNSHWRKDAIGAKESFSSAPMALSANTCIFCD